MKEISHAIPGRLRPGENVFKQKQDERSSLKRVVSKVPFGIVYAQAALQESLLWSFMCFAFLWQFMMKRVVNIFKSLPILIGKSCDLPTLKTICQVKNSSISNSLLFGTWQNEKKGNSQHASRKKTLFSWSVSNMQVGRGFAKLFSKLPYMRGERGFLPSCHILPSHLSNCWRGILSVFSKN